jgi:hypothetical protein
MVSLDDMITVAEAGRRLGRSLEQVRRYLREGKLKGQRIGGQWFVEEASLPVQYQPLRKANVRIREGGVMMTVPKLRKEEREDLIKRINENRDAIRRRLGHGFDISQLIEESRGGR